MNERTRRVFVILPVLVTVAVAAVIGVFVVIERQDRAEEVAAADAVANRWYSQVAEFRVALEEQITAQREVEPAELRDVLDAALQDPPVLGDAPADGMRTSSVYRDAVRDQATLLDPYVQLSDVLAAATDAKAFIDAATTLLDTRPTDFVGFGPLRDATQVRDALIPGFDAALAEFDAVEVPDGQGELASTVRGAVQFVVDQSRVLVDRAAVGQNYSFEYSEQYGGALDAVSDYATVVDGDVSEAISAALDAE